MYNFNQKNVTLLSCHIEKATVGIAFAYPNYNECGIPYSAQFISCEMASLVGQDVWPSSFELNSCQFDRNYKNVEVFRWWGHKFTGYPEFQNLSYQFVNCRFDKHSGQQDSPYSVLLRGVENVEFSECEFAGNMETDLYVHLAQVRLLGSSSEGEPGNGFSNYTGSSFGNGLTGPNLRCVKLLNLPGTFNSFNSSG